MRLRATLSLSRWMQRQRVLSGPGQKRGRLATHPGLVTGAVERRPGMPALTAWHVQYPRGLAPGRHHEALGGTEARHVHMRHVVVAGHRHARHVEPAAEQRDGAAQGVTNADRIALAPAATVEAAFAAVAVDAGDRVVDGRQDEFPPARVTRIEQVRRPLRYEPPGRFLELPWYREICVRARGAGRDRQCLEYPLLDQLVEAPHVQVADRCR